MCVCVSFRSYKSVDGRTTPLLCGTNPPTPQPASPDPGHCPLLHDYSHVPSPMSPASPDTTSNPHTPCSRDSHRLLSSEDTRCSTPDFTFEERVREQEGGATWSLLGSSLRGGFRKALKSEMLGNSQSHNPLFLILLFNPQLQSRFSIDSECQISLIVSSSISLSISTFSEHAAHLNKK